MTEKQIKEIKPLSEEELKAVPKEEITDGKKPGSDEVEAQMVHLTCQLCGGHYTVYGFPAYSRCPWCGSVGRVIY